MLIIAHTYVSVPEPQPQKRKAAEAFYEQRYETLFFALFIEHVPYASDAFTHESTMSRIGYIGPLWTRVNVVQEMFL